MMTDPIADMLTRMRNALVIERPHVDMPLSKMKTGVADVLQREGYIWDYEVLDTAPAKTLRINLKYSATGERVIQRLTRVSKPGRRVYSESRKLQDVMQGMGIFVLSTNQGMLSSREAKAKHVGGEVVCEVW
ncbi:30S ribosomal protein S8 [Planctomicrobium piriforme]|uniref:Small ribosomal subunit protein uS8 n=1 Tax=Planctomicrobium piriforme TaxID=1576369 RepID=A0A1I3C730_9PLAN|nr:30S ribosomal protein S8 [Planctomicrobium piriforme]SFH70310.1 small subunit ribosomal protein S8 [Planctomicrobium piriforme]